MPVEAGRVELGQAVHFVDVGVDAVGDWDVNQAVVGSQGHRRLCPLLRQRIQPRPRASSKNDSQHSLRRHMLYEVSSLKRPYQPCWHEV